MFRRVALCDLSQIGDINMARKSSNPASGSSSASELVRYTFNVSKDQAQKSPDQVTMEFDFTNVTRGALMTEAMRAIAIRIQSQMRALPTRKENPVSWSNVVKQYNDKRVNVAEALANTRAKIAPSTKIAKIAESASESEINAAIAALQASLKTKKTQPTK